MTSTLTYLHEVGVSFQGGQDSKLKAFAHATHQHPPLVHSAKQPESHDWIRGFHSSMNNLKSNQLPSQFNGSVVQWYLLRRKTGFDFQIEVR